MTPQWLLDQELEDTILRERQKHAYKKQPLPGRKTVKQGRRLRGRCELCGDPVKKGDRCHAHSWPDA